MKYAVWFVRLLFVAWMLPAGINHFIPLFPQPLGNQLLSRELFAALEASRLFDLVKIVELVAALCLLAGVYVPLALLLCMPVSFCVWYWDVPLQGWGSISAIYGWAVLLSNMFLCLAYLPSYRAMLTPRAAPSPTGAPSKGAAPLVLAGRFVFGLWMVSSGLNFFVMPLIGMPTGHEPLAVQLMRALTNSQLLHVAMAIQLVAGAFILAGLFVPLALCMLMPVSVCAAYWAVVLEQGVFGALLSLLAVALNGALMFAYLDHYRALLRRDAVALGEAAGPNMHYESLFVHIGGRTRRGAFIGALVPLLAVALFYHFLVFGLPGQWAMLTLIFPALVLYGRRLRDMGRSVWWLLIAAIPGATAIWFHMFNPGTDNERAALLVALAICALITLWALAGKSERGALIGRAAVA
jgi:uncharacterized membrane protein YhaH (DUF805 family)/uncharacterized membrane protein YphA (DoxX/SURF4 family)